MYRCGDRRVYTGFPRGSSLSSEKDECADDSEPRASGPSGSLEDVVGTMVPWRTATAFKRRAISRNAGRSAGCVAQHRSMSGLSSSGNAAGTWGLNP